MVIIGSFFNMFHVAFCYSSIARFRNVYLSSLLHFSLPQKLMCRKNRIHRNDKSKGAEKILWIWFEFSSYLSDWESSWIVISLRTHTRQWFISSHSHCTCTVHFRRSQCVHFKEYKIKSSVRSAENTKQGIEKYVCCAL